MKNILSIFFFTIFMPTLLISQTLSRPRNPIMVINCDTDGLGNKRNLIQLRDSHCDPEITIEINGYCYLIVDCENEEEIPEGWKSMEWSESICIAVPDCELSIGCGELGCDYYIWNTQNLTCDCFIENEAQETCGCPEVLVDPELVGEDDILEYIDNEDFEGCIEIVSTPCYDGELDIIIPPLSCRGFEPGDEVLFSILIIGIGAEIGDALTLEQLENCDLIGGQSLVLELVQGSGSVGWIFKDGTDEGLPGEAVIKIEFTRDPFLESIIGLEGREPIIIPPCSQQIPSISTWGLIILSLLIMLFGSLVARRRYYAV